MNQSKPLLDESFSSESSEQNNSSESENEMDSATFEELKQVVIRNNEIIGKLRMECAQQDFMAQQLCEKLLSLYTIRPLAKQKTKRRRRIFKKY